MPSLMISAAFHATVLFLGGRMLFQPVQYGIEIGSGGMEILLVAASPQRARAGNTPAVPELPPVQPTAEDLVLRGPAEQTPTQGQSAHRSSFTGDGSSPMPGQDPTTFYSAGGGQTDAKPGYLKNPAPPYPYAARRLGQEGVVVLLISIDSTGHPTEVEVQRSSGHSTLDESALTTIRRWKFTPARMAGVPVNSVAHLKVNFLLKEKEKYS